jgi:hypothetical protein
MPEKRIRQLEGTAADNSGGDPHWLVLKNAIDPVSFKGPTFSEISWEKT